MSLISNYEEVAAGDWQRDYLFKVLFDPPALVAALLPADIDVFVLNAKAPGSKQKVIKKDWAGQWANFAGPLDNPGTTDIEFQVDEGGKLLKFLDAWHELSGSDITAAAYPKADIIGTMYTTLYRSDKETPVFTTILNHVWFPEVGDLNLQKSGEGLLSVKCTVAYDSRRNTYHR